MYKTVAMIEGMSCGMCEAHIQDAIRKNLRVKKVKASHSKGSCEIISEQPVSQDELHKVIDPTGYTLQSVSSEPYEKKGLFGR